MRAFTACWRNAEPESGRTGELILVSPHFNLRWEAVFFYHSLLLHRKKIPGK